MAELDDKIYQQIVFLCEQGDACVNSGEFPLALQKFADAWRLLPEPKTNWSAAMWILAAIGDTQFFLGDFAGVIDSLEQAMWCPDAIGNPFLHLRLGEAYFETGNLQKAADQLTRSYMSEGREIFAGENPKYFEYLKTVLEPPPGEQSI